MRALLYAFGLSSVFALGPLASAAQTSGNDFYGLCASGDDLGETACLMYVVGAVNGMEWAADVAAYDLGARSGTEIREAGQRLVHVCTPAHATGTQHHRVVMRYMKRHPQDWHKPAIVLIHRAIMEAYPC